MPALRGRAQRPPHSSLCCHHRLDDNFRRAIGKSNNPGTIIASTIDLIPSAALIRNCVGIQWKSIGKTFNVQSEIVPRDTIKRDMPSETCRSCTSWAGRRACSLLLFLSPGCYALILPWREGTRKLMASMACLISSSSICLWV